MSVLVMLSAMLTLCGCEKKPAEPAVSEQTAKAACPPDCTKPCCAKQAACPPDCTKPCCAKQAVEAAADQAAQATQKTVE